MYYRESPALGFLSSFVECYWQLELGAHEAGSVQRIVPDGRAELIVNLAHPFESFEGGHWRMQPPCFLAGQITGPLLLRPAGHTKTLGVRFKPHCAGLVLGFPILEATDSILAIQEFSPVLARRLEPAVDFADIHLALCPSTAASKDPLIEHVVRQMELGLGDIGKLARGAGISTRQLERRFLNQVGLQPKLFFRMRRFQKIFQRIEQDSSGWAATALQLGYFDQAHLIRDFKLFAGEPPSGLLARADLAAHFLDQSAMSRFSKTGSSHLE